MRDSLQTSLEPVIARLAEGIRRWARRSLADRAELIRATHRTIADCAGDWHAAAVAVKGGDDGWLEAEEWLSGPYAALGGYLGVAESLDALAEGRSPVDGLQTGSAPGGRVTLRVLPSRARERILLNGFRADVWLQPGVTLEEARAAAGLGGRRLGEDGGVAAVLGAGNVTAIGPLDVLDQLVAHNRASILKVNPVLGGMVPVYHRALRPLIEADLLSIVAGDAEAGQALVRHPGIRHVHLTGSRRTHDAVVWGPGDEGTARRLAGRPALTATVSSELGGVSPCIVVPGVWTDEDLRYQAEHVVTQRMHNAGHNCIATQVLILSDDWPQRAAFLTEIRRVLHRLPRREPWYPGSQQVMTQVAELHPGAELHAGCYLVGVPPGQSDDLFQTESFTPALAHTSLPGTGADFLRRAVAFANDRVDGTLGVGVLVSPADRRAMGRDFEEILADLRYGAIGINVWTGLLFVLPSAAWGAYPGHDLHEVGSGIGVVHNSFLLDHTERTVAEGPFRPFPRSVSAGELALFPKPPWFVTARAASDTGLRMTEYAKAPAWARLLPVLPPAYRA